MNKKLIGLILGLIVITLIIGVGAKKYNTYKEDLNITEVKSSLSDYQKEMFNYTYEIPNTFRVVDIISEEEILVEEESKLKVYNLKEEKFTEEMIDVTKDYVVTFAKVFNKGIAWVETYNKKEPKSKIYVKYFEDDNVIELEMCNSDIVPSVSVTSNYLTYYIQEDNDISVKYFDLEERCVETIASYEFNNDEGQIYISNPNTNDKEIVWSGTKKGKSILYSYNIEEGTISMFSEEGTISDPVLKGNRMFAIEMYDYYDEELDCEYASDFIVEYNYKTNTWNKFEEDRISNYVDVPQECIVQLEANEGTLLQWGSTLNAKHVYDVKNSEFISLIKEENNLGLTILNTKNNIVYYNVYNYEDVESHFIYIIPDNK